MVQHITPGLPLAHRIYPDQNYHFPSDSEPILSRAHSGRRWARINSTVGKETANYLEISFILSIIKNYISNYFETTSSWMGRIAEGALESVQGFLDGLRDKRMYWEDYARDLFHLKGKELSDDEISDHQRLMNEGYIVDDALENQLLDANKQKKEEKEKVIPKLWEWATSMAFVKPILGLISGFLPKNWRKALYTLEETPSRILWRARFMAGSIHTNFPSTVWNLFLSVFNKDIRKDTLKYIGEASREYFKSKNEHGRKYIVKGKSPLRLYCEMIIDRLTEHWNNIQDPAGALKEKLEDGFFKKTTLEERSTTPDRTIDKGYVCVDNQGNINSSEDIKHQRFSAITDFTGPIFGGLGLIGAGIFTPLSAIWSILGIKRGQNLLNGLAASRTAFSLGNYFTRFITDELEHGGQYRNLERMLNPADGQSAPNKATRQMHYAMKSRFNNGIFGILIVMGSFIEPFVHFFRSRFENSRFSCFLADTLERFNENGLVRLFSKRRECNGWIELINSLVKEKISDHKIKAEDYGLVSDEDFDHAVRGKQTEEPVQEEKSAVHRFLSKFTTVYDKAKKAVSGDYEGIDLLAVERA